MAAQATRYSGAHAVYTELKRRIMNLELAPGERLYEPALAASLEVSRTPLREAIRRLTSEHLLSQQPTGGVVVPRLDPREIAELYDVRASLESLMAREATRRATKDDLAELDEILARNAALVGFADDAMDVGKRLHDTIARIADNGWAVRLHEQIADQMVRYRVVTNSSQTRRETALQEHRDIRAAVASGDPDHAATVAFDHVLSARDEALRAVEGTLDT
jgi:DNA-binding GntR family transcriptional regulator